MYVDGIPEISNGGKLAFKSIRETNNGTEFVFFDFNKRIDIAKTISWHRIYIPKDAKIEPITISSPVSKKVELTDKNSGKIIAKAFEMFRPTNSVTVFEV